MVLTQKNETNDRSERLKKPQKSTRNQWMTTRLDRETEVETTAGAAGEGQIVIMCPRAIPGKVASDNTHWIVYN